LSRAEALAELRLEGGAIVLAGSVEQAVRVSAGSHNALGNILRYLNQSRDRTLLQATTASFHID
jgi:hypothetical protein